MLLHCWGTDRGHIWLERHLQRARMQSLLFNRWHRAAAVINASKRLERSCTHSQTRDPHSSPSHSELSPEPPRVVRELLLVHQRQLLPRVRLKERRRLARAQRKSCNYQHKDHGRSNQGQPALHRSRCQATQTCCLCQVQSVLPPLEEKTIHHPVSEKDDLL